MNWKLLAVMAWVGMAVNCLGAAGTAPGVGAVGGSMQTVNPNTWIWMASGGNSSIGDGTVALWTSSNGTSDWARASSPSLYDLNQNTNAPGIGPVNSRWSMFFNAGQWWSAKSQSGTGQAANPGALGGTAQGISLSRSSDLTNWVKEVVVYPLGTTNAGAAIAGANWFQDTDLSVYLIFTYVSNGVTSCYQTKASDGTLTNWAAPVWIDSGNYTQYGFVVKGTNGVYQLYYACKSPDHEWLRDTNNTLASRFTAQGTNFWSIYSDDAASEQANIINVGGTRWRAFIREGTSNTISMFYVDSFDDLATWAFPWKPLNTASNFWGAQGIALAPAAATNVVFGLGQSNNQGQAVVRTPLLLANSVQAKDGWFKNGIFTASLSALGSVASGNALSADSLYISNLGGSNLISLTAGTFTLNSGNVIADAPGNLTVAGALTSILGVSFDGAAITSSGSGALTAVKVSAGIASTAANAATAIGVKGWTNTFLVNAVVYYTTTTVPATLINAARTSLLTLNTTNGSVNLQPGWAITNTAGMAGTAVPW